MKKFSIYIAISLLAASNSCPALPLNCINLKNKIGDIDKNNNYIDISQGKYKMKNAIIYVKPIKMAYSIRWNNDKQEHIYFFGGKNLGYMRFIPQEKSSTGNIFYFKPSNYSLGIYIDQHDKCHLINREQ